MTITNDEYVIIFDLIAKECRDKVLPITSLDQEITEIGLDSLDFVTFFIYMDSIWGLPDKEFNEHRFMDKESVPTFSKLIILISEIHVNEDVSFDDAVESLSE